MLKYILYLGLSAALASTEYEIKWCNEPNLGGPCITEPVKTGEYTVIPDFSAKGDQSSSFEVRTHISLNHPFFSARVLYLVRPKFMRDRQVETTTEHPAR